jgi:hypothetical protein
LQALICSFLVAAFKNNTDMILFILEGQVLSFGFRVFPSLPRPGELASGATRDVIDLRHLLLGAGTVFVQDRDDAERPPADAPAALLHLPVSRWQQGGR